MKIWARLGRGRAEHYNTGGDLCQPPVLYFFGYFSLPYGNPLCCREVATLRLLCRDTLTVTAFCSNGSLLSRLPCSVSWSGRLCRIISAVYGYVHILTAYLFSNDVKLSPYGVHLGRVSGFYGLSFPCLLLYYSRG